MKAAPGRNDDRLAQVFHAKQLRDRALSFALRDCPAEGAHCVIFLSARPPMDQPDLDGFDTLFDSTLVALHHELPPFRTSGTHEDALGLYHIYATTGAPRPTKERCVAFESALPWRALFDIDVFEPSGSSVDRAGCGLPPRVCMLCGGQAKACSRENTHSAAELEIRAHELMARGLCK